jgi:hypothetical protein
MPFWARSPYGLNSRFPSWSERLPAGGGNACFARPNIRLQWTLRVRHMGGLCSDNWGIPLSATWPNHPCPARTASHLECSAPASEYQVVLVSFAWLEQCYWPRLHSQGCFVSAPWVETRNSQESRQVRQRLSGIPAAIFVLTCFFEVARLTRTASGAHAVCRASRGPGAPLRPALPQGPRSAWPPSARKRRSAAEHR